MRRKLFFYTLLLLVLIFVILNIRNVFYNEENIVLAEDKYVAEVLSIERSDNTYMIVAKIDTGEKVLLKCYAQKQYTPKLIGATICFRGKLDVPKGKTNPRCFDYRLYLKSLGIRYLTTIDDIEILNYSNNMYNRYCQYLLIKKDNFLNSILDSNTRSFVDGILFGNTDNLDQSVYDDFKQNGTAHILAVSGLHIGIIYKIVQKILGNRQSLVNLAVSTILLWSLGILTSWTPSVIRAIGMIVIKNYALYFDKRYDSLTSLSLIALGMIINNPYVVFNVSFQMSFLAVISIIFITPHFSIKIPDFLVIILSVNIGLMPYQMFQFNTFSITSFMANIPVVYLAGILLPITFIQFIIFVVMGINIDILTKALSYLLIHINRICTFDLENINVTSPALWMIIIFYGIGLFLLSESFFILKSRKKGKIIIAIILIICTFAALINLVCASEFDEAEIVFVDVGQGDCVHIKTESKNILIDGGGSVNYEVGKKTLIPYLLKNRVKKIDLAIATHMHTDHYKGLSELVENGLADDIHVGLCAGKTFKIDDNIWIQTLWPIKNSSKDINQDENKNCSVFMINYKGIRILITGDLDVEGENEMLEYYKGSNVLKADILKVGHHGSQYSTSNEFLTEVNPEYCIIQVGRNNYGHPHTKTIEKCQEKCIMLLRNDIHGAIGFSFEKESIEYCTMIKMDGR